MTALPFYIQEAYISSCNWSPSGLLKKSTISWNITRGRRAGRASYVAQAHTLVANISCGRCWGYMKTRRVVIRLSDDEMECLSEYGQLLVSYGYIKKNTSYAAANCLVRLVLDQYDPWSRHFPVGSSLGSTSRPPKMVILRVGIASMINPILVTAHACCWGENDQSGCSSFS